MSEDRMLVERDISGETFAGFRVAAWRETHPEHGDKYGHHYSEHWSTPSTRDPRVKVERLFTEDQLTTLLNRISALEEALAWAEDADPELVAQIRSRAQTPSSKREEPKL